MAITQNTYTGNGSTVLYSFAFPYLDTADVKVSLNGTITTAYTFANATTIQFNTAPGVGVAIRIYRETDDTALQAVLSPGSSIRASDLNDNFDQLIYLGQEANNEADSATATANTALTNANTAISTANTASTNASNAVSTANTASANASAAVSTANTANTNASNAVSTANTASTNASAAVTTANTALSTANSATTTANNAVSTANSALTAANNAVSTANTASSNATTAVNTANTASSNATTALTTANSALSTANTALTNSSTAITTANSAIAAVASAVIYTPVANLTALAALTPANGDYFELTDSTGAEGSALITGVTVGLVGAPGLTFRLRYDSPPGIYTFLGYFANDSETRYLKFSGGTLTGQLRGDDSASAATPGFAFDGDPNTGVGRPGADELALITGGTNRLTIDSAGAVAIPGTLGVTGNVSGGALIPSGSTVPTNGVYLPSANNVAISTNGTGRLFVDSSGRILFGTSTHSGNTRVVVSGRSDGNAGGTLVLESTSSSPANGDTLGNLRYGTSGNTASLAAAAIGAERDGGTWTNNSSMPARLVFSTTADGASSPTERLRITSDGKVGLGTSSPSYTLDVSGTARITSVSPLWLGTTTGDSYIQYGANATTANNWTVGSQADGTFRFFNGTYASGTERLRITSAGNVGIGNNAPDNTLSLGAVGSIDQDANSVYIGNNFTSTGANFKKTGNYAQQLMFDTATGSLIYKASASTGTAGNAITFSERFRCDSAGRLLVGTSDGSGSVARLIVQGASNSSPVTQFQIAYNGNANSGFAANGTLGEIRFTDQASNSNLFAVIKAETDGVTGTNDYPGRLTFSTTADGASSPTERMRITSGGFVGIGTTSPGGNFAVSSGSANGVEISINETGSENRFLSYNRSTSQRTDLLIDSMQVRFATGSGATEQMRLTSSGNLQFNSGYGSVATAYGCRAWVNFNGTGTVSIRASGNVSSITDNGTGDYTVNFTTALADANYAVAATAEWNPGVDFKRASVRRSAIATGSVRLGVDFGGGTSADSELVFVTIFR